MTQPLKDLPDSVIEAGVKVGNYNIDPRANIRRVVEDIFLAMAKALVEHDRAEKFRQLDPANWSEKKKALHRDIFATERPR